jgi:hypothetical protein
MKRCLNCNNLHDGMFDDCYQCFDCETEFEYEQRREEAEIIRKNTEWMISQDK